MEDAGEEASNKQVENPNTEDAEATDTPDKTQDLLNEASLNFSTNSNKSNTEEAYQNTTENGEKKEKNNPEENASTEERLSGWLQLRSRGIGNLKVNRMRWFLYVEDNCKLYIYRDPSDLVPLGEICIATASFYFDAGHAEKPGLFKIKSDSKEYLLDAGSRQDMVLWLQRLQHKRREYNIAKSSTLTDNVGHWSNKHASQFSGLLSKEAADSPKASRKSADPGSGILEYPEIHITVPESLTNSTTISSSSAGSSSVRALNNLRSELSQAISSIKKPAAKSLKEDDRESLMFYCQHADDQDRLSVSTLSTTSINSDDSQTFPPEGTTVKTQLQSELSVAANKNRASSFETSSGRLNPFDKEFLLRQRSNTSGSATLKNTQIKGEERRTGSWTVISQNDIPPSEAKEVMEQKGLKKTSSNSMFYTEMQENESTEKADRSISANQTEEGKAKNLMSTLKRGMRIGKRQVSEPGTPGKSVSKPAQVCSKCKAPVSMMAPSSTISDSQGSNGAEPERTKQDVEEELNAHKEIIILLQNKLADMVNEEKTRKEMSSIAEEDKSSIIMEKTKLTDELQLQLTDIKNENKSLIAKVESLTLELQETMEQVTMYTDMLNVKDQIIMKMTNQAFDQENPGQGPGSFDQPELTSPTVSRESMTSLRSDKSIDEKEFERLRDMCQGYELQHKFLTKEILEMNELRKMDQIREKDLEMRLATTKASYCQVKSKYLVLLKHQKEQAPLREGDEDQDVVSQLLQDAMEPDSDDVDLQLTGSSQQYDKYGFSKKHYMDEFEDVEELDPLSNKAAELERQSTEISTKVREADQEASLRVKWENYMAGKENKLRRSPELKSLIRQGVPHEYREKVWKGCINLYISNVREEKGPDFYQSLLQAKAAATGSDPAIKQIELDLLRTLPNNKHYDAIDSHGIGRLRRVLLAFSEYNRHIGYCQGLNRVAAIALLFLSEEDAFWCLVAIVDHVLPPEYFSKTLMAAQADQRVLKDLVADKLPRVHQALENQGVDLSLFTFNWFLTVFVDGVPTETFLRIWDTFLYEGSKVLFRFAIAFLKMVENEILQQNDGLQLNRYLRRIGDKMTNIKMITFYAFNWINPFPISRVATRRQQHLADIRVELQELDKLRHGMKVEREHSRQHDYMSDDDLDA